MMALVNVKSLALLAWALVNGSLLLSIGGELGWGDTFKQSIPVPVVLQPVPIEIVLPLDFRLPVRERAYAQSLERPLFVPSRRKAPPVPPVLPPSPPPPPPPPTMQKGQFQLMGTIITGEMRVAVVKEVSSGKERQIVQGYTINGLQLQLVEAGRIVFTQYEDSEEIQLKIQRSSRPAVAPQGRQPANQQAAPATSQQTGGWGQGTGVPAGQVERPAPIAPPPQTMEERKRDLMLKDFYKK